MARCARRGAAPAAKRMRDGAPEPLRGAAPGRRADATGAANADAAGVADSKRNLVYGLHAINAVLDRAPERLLELWVALPREDARLNELRDRARNAGVHVQAVGAEVLAKLVGDVAHQGAAASVRPLKAWDEHDLL